MMKFAVFFAVVLGVTQTLSALPAQLVHLSGREGWIHHPAEKKFAPVPTNLWMGFRWHEQGFRLEPITVTETKTDINNCMGGRDQSFHVKPVPGLLLMMRSGKKDLRPGQVLTSFSGEFILEPGASIALSPAGMTCTAIPDSCYQLRAVGRRIKEKSGETPFRDYQVFLKFQGVEHVLFRQSEYFDKPVSLKWAGDLNRDGHLDLILNQNYWPGGPGSSIYMSTPQKDLPVQLYAEQNHEQC